MMSQVSMFLRQYKIVLSISLLLFAVGAYIFGDIDDLLSQKDAVAKVTSLKGSIERRSENSPFWQKLKPNDKLQNGDRVRSGANSSAQIVWKTKETESLKPNSMLIVKARTKSGDTAFKLEFQFTTDDLATPMVFVPTEILHFLTSIIQA